MFHQPEGYDAMGFLEVLVADKRWVAYHGVEALLAEEMLLAELEEITGPNMFEARDTMYREARGSFLGFYCVYFDTVDLLGNCRLICAARQ